MQPLDDTDREILRLLLEDGRRPYSEIGAAVDLSGPDVSDRIDRLRERGIVRGFTVDLDRSVLQEGAPLLLTLDVAPGVAARVADALLADDAVEHVVRTADERVVATATVPDGEATDLLEDAGVLDDVSDLDVALIASTDWNVWLGDAEFAPDCVQCGNTVDEEGASATIDDETYYFCCASFEAAFRERYESIADGA